MFSRIEVEPFYFRLRGFKRTRDDTILNWFVFGNTEAPHHVLDGVVRENTHERIFHRDEKLRFSRIALTTRSAAKLVINTPRFMALGTEYKKSSDFAHKARFIGERRITS